MDDTRHTQQKASIFRRKTFWYLITAVGITTILIRIFIFDSFTVRGNSMAPTIIDGDYVFVNKLAYLSGSPERSDVVVGNFREMGNIKVIKRVIGLPREYIEMGRTTVTVKDSRYGEEVVLTEPYTEDIDSRATTSYRYRLDPYEYLLLGDNRLGSVDSRELGPVDVYDVDGEVVWRFRFSDLSFKRVE